MVINPLIPRFARGLKLESGENGPGLVLIGLDGGNMGVLGHLLERGMLGNLEKILENGTSGTMETCFPPLTPPAWMGIASGKNPGKTGIFDFYNRTSTEDLRMRSMNSGDMRRAGTFWDILSSAGYRIGVFNYPFLRPTYEINGFMTSGLGAGEAEEVTYPRGLKAELERVCGRYRIHVYWFDRIYNEDPELFLGDLGDLLEFERAAIEHLLSTKEMDVFVAVISAIDFLQHYMLDLIDPGHPRFDEPRAEMLRPGIDAIWEKLDEILGVVRRGMNPGGNFLFVSDHGFCPNLGVFHANSWLEREGYLHRSPSMVRRLYGMQSSMLNVIKRRAPVLAEKITKLATPSTDVNPQTIEFDLDRTRAYMPRGTSMSGGKVYFTDGVEDVESLRAEMAGRLEDYCRENGLGVGTRSPAEEYDGPFLPLSPDFLFEINGFRYDITPDFSSQVFVDETEHSRGTGTHDPNAVFIASGNDFARGIKIEGTRIYDVAPTILHLIGLPVPADMDGRVLTEIFAENSEPSMRSPSVAGDELGSRLRKLKRSGRV